MKDTAIPKARNERTTDRRREAKVLQKVESQTKSETQKEKALRVLGSVARFIPSLILAAVFLVLVHWFGHDAFLAGTTLVADLRLAFVCLLAAFTIITVAMRFVWAAESSRWSYLIALRQEEPWQTGYPVVATVIVAMVLVFAVRYYPQTGRLIQIAACITVLVATTRILYAIGSRQIRKIVRYGYYATALILAAEAVMVMLLGGAVEHG
ncbi:hypothetical protein [Paraburkholderia sp. C35]|uniref:hypothetical protein n=1 Tax=Paraburkholderia sp. C35 TaxID=2126993 RepID=UPI0013A59EB8|nr:hypothetical protein [Paraburkholderia sp. C35]